MTITTPFTTPEFADFALGAGVPSRHQWTPQHVRTTDEDLLVTALREYAQAIARRCLHDQPAEYEDYIADLTEVDPGDAPTARNARFTYLLHSYADYMPSPDCEFKWLGEEYHAWQSPDCTVIVDVVTTLAWKELAGGEDEYKVFEASQAARLSFGNDLFAGVRYIVLDAPFESTWYPAQGEPQQYLTSDLNGLSASTGCVQ